VSRHPDPARGADTGEFDLGVIGAGINGAAIARDAALRGLRVLVLEQGDLCSGTSAWSTRLIHGGLRYLEHAEISLVRESLRERETLLRTAPHLVRPLELLLPIYRGDARGPRMVRAGMIAYDLLSLDKSLPRHRALSLAQTREREPGLTPSGLRGAAVYFDCQVTFPERLVTELVLAARAAGAAVRTYTRVERLVARPAEAGAGTGSGAPSGFEVAARDVLTGAELRATARCVVNAGGPWVDRVLTRVAGNGADRATAPRLIGGTKGSHIVVAPFPGTPRQALYAQARSDARPFFIIRWNGLVLIGTTEVRFDADPVEAVATPEEIEYLLAETRRLIPGCGLGGQSVLYSYAGVRPLPPEDEVPAAVTRRHMVREHGPEVPGLFSIIGGKLTTHRGLAEEVVDAILARLGREHRRSTTGTTRLPGFVDRDEAADLTRRIEDKLIRAQRTGTDLEARQVRHSAERLVSLYGSRADGPAGLAAAEPGLARVIDPDTGALGAEVAWALEAEGARTLADVLLRRTMIGLGRRVGLPAVDDAAAVAAAVLGWSPGQARDEAEAYRAERRRRSPVLGPAGVI